MSKQTKGVEKMKTTDAGLPQGWAREIDKWLIDQYCACVEEGIATPGHFWRDYVPTELEYNINDTRESSLFRDGLCERLQIDPDSHQAYTVLWDYYSNREPFYVELTGRAID